MVAREDAAPDTKTAEVDEAQSLLFPARGAKKLNSYV